MGVEGWLSQGSKRVNVKTVYLWVWSGIKSCCEQKREAGHGHMSRVAICMKGESRDGSPLKSLCEWAAGLVLDMAVPKDHWDAPAQRKDGVHSRRLRVGWDLALRNASGITTCGTAHELPGVAQER